MDLYSLLNNDKKAFKEDGFDEIPAGDVNNPDTMMEDSGGGGNMDSGGFDDNYSDEGYSDDDSYNDGSDPQNRLPFEDVDDSEIALVSDLRDNFAKLYDTQFNVYNKLKSENLESTEFAKDFEFIIDNYKRTLNLLYRYIDTKYANEATTTKIMTFLDFKEQFTNYADRCNKLFAKINHKYKDDNLFSV